MGAEVPARRARAVIAACVVLAMLGVAGCGQDDDEQTNVSETATLGPQSAEGDIESSPATLRAEDGYSTLVTTQITTRGNEDTLVAGQVELTGSAQPEFRLKVDEKVAKGVQVDVSESDGNRVAVVSCACKFKTGTTTSSSRPRRRARPRTVGARTLVVFAEVELDDSGASPVSGSTLVTDKTQVESEGVTLAETSTEGGDGGGPLLVIASIASPKTGTGSENVRSEVRIGGEITDEVAKTTIPTGKLVAYLDNDGAGEDVELRGYTTSGRTAVGVSSIIACNCGIAR